MRSKFLNSLFSLWGNRQEKENNGGETKELRLRPKRVRGSMLSLEICPINHSFSCDRISDWRIKAIAYTGISPKHLI